MSINISPIEQFFNTVNSFDKVVCLGEQKRQSALSNQKELVSNLNRKIGQLISTKESLSPLAAEIENVALGISETIKTIDNSTLAMDQRLQLQREYSERLIILVFGKVNVGKSSFSNYLVTLFQTYLPNEPLKYFFFEEGKKVYSTVPFKEGSTETTARIQGVELGKIVLLDTPGLHSVIEINGELTKKYTDSADLILWLSGSNSPGQTQELEALKTEINKGKVLFPVITKSDVIDEDIEFVDGIEQIVQKLEMKSDDTQKLQQDDVYERAKAKLLNFNKDINLQMLHSPVSLSTHYAKEYSHAADILNTAGIDSLFNGLNAIYDQAIESKKSNVITQINNHLETIQESLSTNIEMPFNILLASLEEQKEFIQNQSECISSMVLNSARTYVPKIIAKHEQERDKDAIKKEINHLLTKEIATQLQLTFDTVFKALLDASAIPANIDIDLDSDFENDEAYHKYKTGAAKKSLTKGVASVLGSVAAGIATTALVSNPAGWLVLVAGVVGATAASTAGDYAGDLFIQTETIAIVMGVNSDKIEAEINCKLQEIVPSTIQQYIDSILSQFTPLEKIIKQSITEIEKFKGENK